jgi:DNA repair photolyase
MPRDIRELEVRQAINRVTGMPFRWSLNPYRGCQHACAYCYARATHRFLNLGAGIDFSQILFVKINLPEVLRSELHRPGWRGECIALGTATDPYQPLEGRYQITRQCLMELERAGNPVQIITKGTLIQRDVDILGKLASRGLVEVLFSVPTVDRQVARLSEPGTPAPESRLKALATLRAAGIPAGVLLSPLLPGITDDRTHIYEAMWAARAAGALFADGSLVRLAPDVKPVYFQFIETFYPGLLPLYKLWYRDGPNAPPDLRRRTASRLNSARAVVGLPARAARPLIAPSTQLAWAFEPPARSQQIPGRF